MAFFSLYMGIPNMMPLIKKLGSLRFAVFLILSLAALLGFSTVMESLHGTPFAQKFFYNARWFDVFLSLLWINIFCSTLTRFPFKKHHTGFVITHIGILLLLFGALLSRIFGVEGQITLFEGEEKNRVVQPGYALRIWREGERASMLDLEAAKNRLGKTLPLSLQGIKKLTPLRILEHAKVRRVLSESGRASAVNHAVNATVSSDTFGVKEDVALIENDPENPHANSVQLGPARFELVIDANKKNPKLRLRRKTTGDVFLFELNGNPDDEMPLGESGLRLFDLHYFPHAKVVDQKLIDSPSDVAFNPAVQFQVKDTKDRVEEHTKFYLFPQFSSLRGGASHNFFDLEVQIEPPEDAAETQSTSPAFSFVAMQDGSWRYRISSSKTGTKEGALELGKKIETGWMDLAVEPKKTFGRAQLSTKVEEAHEKNRDAGNFAAQINVVKNDGSEETAWITEGGPVEIETAIGPYRLALFPKTKLVPFTLKLADFRKIDYPGTMNAAAFESDVSVFDPLENSTLAKTIRMNKPLDIKGYRIFQSSYIQDPDLGEASVFTVSKNPGIRFIYSGAAIILFGVIVLFYLHPFFKV